MLLNASRDIRLAVNTRETNYVKIGRLRGRMVNEHVIMDRIHFYEEVSLLTNQNSINEEIKCRFQQKIYIIIHYKTLFISRLFLIF